MLEIAPRLVDLDTLFTRHLFRIPQYQRTYSWRKKQRQDLFKDIRRTSDSGQGRPHFMATVVGLRRDKRNIGTTDHQVIEVVDGQQRITTLVLLLKTIAIHVEREEPEQANIASEINSTLVKSDGPALLLLQTNHDTSSYFNDYLLYGTYPSPDSAKTDADREILSAIEDCEEFVTEWSNPIKDLVTLLKNRLVFLFHEIGDETLVYTVFEVLNSRGLQVSWFDRLKSMLMAIVFESDGGNRSELVDEIHRLWSDIYRCLGLQREDLSAQTLRFAATLWRDDCPYRLLSEEDAVQLLVDASAAGPSQVIQTTNWLKAVAETVVGMRDDQRRRTVMGIIHARLVFAAVQLREDLDETTRDQILRRWETVTFRIYGMFRRDARTSVGNYTSLAWRIIRNKISPEEILDQLSSIGGAFPIDGAVEELREADCYEGWQQELRYFFWRYEEYLCSRAGQNFDNEQWNHIWESSAADSIEHVLPQSKGNADWVHSLGNLLVLPPRLNSRLRAMSPQLKAEEYRKTGLLVADQAVDNLRNTAKWNRRAIEIRGNELLQWARQEWAD